MDGRGPTTPTARPNRRTTPVPGWSEAFPWLCAGTTRRGPNSGAGGAGERSGLGRPPPEPASPGPCLAGEWAGRRIPAESVEALNDHGPWHSVLRSRQVHGTAVCIHRSVPDGFFLAADCDGHATRTPGLLLTVTLADCVPVFLADPAAQAVALLHAGWRGIAGGVVKAGVIALANAFGSRPAHFAVHAGPSICGRCYEVGPEVFAALELPPPPGPALLDLRECVRQRALSVGVLPANVTTSAECTLCDGGRYFSHRGGDRWRHLAFVGIRTQEGGEGNGAGGGSEVRGGSETSGGNKTSGGNETSGGNAAGGTHRGRAGSGTVPGPRGLPASGLCRRCTWSRRVETRRGSFFRLCLRHQEDPSFPKYPTLPVRRCRGFAARP